MNFLYTRYLPIITPIIKHTPENKPNSLLRTVFSFGIKSSELIRDLSAETADGRDNKSSISSWVF